MDKKQRLVFLEPSINRTGRQDHGIIGFGRIGQGTARIAQAMGMKVLAYDTYHNPELVSDTCTYASLDQVFASSDVITLHCPLFPEQKVSSIRIPSAG